MKRRPRLLICGKNLFARPFDARHVRWLPYQAIAGECEQVDLIVVSEARSGHFEDQGRVRIHGAPRLPGPLGHLAYLLCAWRTMRRLRPEVVWSEDPLTAGLAAWIAARRAHCPLVIAVRGDLLRLNRVRWSWLNRAVQQALTLFLVRRADRVRVVFERLGADLRAIGLPPEKVVVLASPTDLDRFDPELHRGRRAGWRGRLGWGDQTVGVLFVGSLNATKGLDLLLDAFAAAQRDEPTLRLGLIGDGPLRPELEARAERLGIAPAVTFAGCVGHDEVPAALAAADALALTSRDEGLPRAAVEAAAMMLPLIITDVGGCAETVIDGVTGYLVSPTVESIAIALRRLARLWPEQRRAMGRAGRRHILRGTFEAQRNNAIAARALLHDLWSPPA